MIAALEDRTLGHRELLERLARFLCPTSYLEIGVREGDSVLAVLRGHTGIRHLTLCDDWGTESGGTGRGSHDHVAEFLNGCSGSVQWLDGRSQDLVPQLSGIFDLVHVDGDHRTEPAYLDLVNGWFLCGKVMVVHDTTFDSVKAALNRFLDGASNYLADYYTGDTGTAVIWRVP